MTARWVTPAWTGPDSPQGPVRVDDTDLPGPEQTGRRNAAGDRAGESVPLPVYKGTVIYVCPACDGDLEHEGDGYWCPACRQSWSFTQVGVYEDEDPHDD